MNLHYRLESAGRTRFLLALSLSTLTALGVAAPLAMQAMRADEATFASGDATASPAVDNRDDLKAEVALSRSLSVDNSGQRGGIQASEDTSKATGRTTKAESVEPIPAEESATEGVLTNAEPEPVEAEPAAPEEPPTEPATDPTIPETTTPVEDTSTSTTETTVEDTSTSSTETTVEDTSTSSTETTATSSTVTSGETPPVPVPAD